MTKDIKDHAKDVKKHAKDIKEHVKEKMEHAKEHAKDIKNHLKEKVEEGKERAKDIKDHLKEKFEDGKERAEEKVKDLKEGTRKESLNAIFIDVLKDMYSSETQITRALSELIKAACSEELKEVFSDHLNETEEQILRLERIFTLLELPAKRPQGTTPCKGMEGILAEGKEMITRHDQSPILDAAIIAGAQKVEHYEMASYRTLIDFVKHLELNSKKEIEDLLKETLKEEEHAEKKLTKIAEGTFFFSGINEKAAEAEMAVR